MGKSKKPKKKAWETRSAFLLSSSVNAELWMLEFFTCELGRQVMLANSAKDYDTNMALEWAIMLPNNVAALCEENSEMIRGLR